VGDLTNNGLGTQLKSSLDALTSYGGLLTKYDENITARLEKLNEEKEKAVTLLNDKYAMMATSFAAYGAMITQMEAAFGGLKMMINQSIASK
jgi:flagellar hook-associated protein 2